MGLQGNGAIATTSEGLNERFATAALAETRGEIQTCLERANFFGSVTLTVHFKGGQLENWEVILKQVKKPAR